MRSILIERESPKNLSDRCHILASALQQQHHHAKDKLFSDSPKSSLSTSRQETIRPFFPVSHFLFPPERVAAKWATYWVLIALLCESIVILKSRYRTSLSETADRQCQALNVAVTSLDSLNCYDQYQVKFFSFFDGSGEIRRCFSRHCNL